MSDEGSDHLLVQKLRTLLLYERDLNRMRNELSELRRWLDAARTFAQRVTGATSEMAAARMIADLFAVDLGFEHASVRCEDLVCDVPPLSGGADRDRVEQLVAACATGPALRIATWNDGNIRFAVGLRVESGPSLSPITVIAARTPRTLPYYPPPWDTLLERFEQLGTRPVHAFGAFRLRKALIAERDSLRSRVEADTVELRAALADAERARAEAERARVEAERARAEAERARAEAEVAARARREFLANMSHEIRTPMTAILGYAELLLEPELTDDTRVEHLLTIRRSGQHLLGLLDDVLDLARFEAGQVGVQRQPCTPGRLLGDVVTMLGARAAEKGLQLDLVILTPMPSRISTDPIRLRQIVINLVGNAIKFTPEGNIEVRARFQRMDDDGFLVIDVIDSGIGMTEDQIARVFEPFVQADTSTTRVFGGSGLGLAIARRVARELGGDVTARSELGKGSVFTARVAAGPIELAEWHSEPEPPTSRPPPASPAELCGRVLVVEDVALNRKLFERMLERLGLEVTLAQDGRDALSIIAAEGREGRSFDAVLLDMQMPIMDGYQTAAELRALGHRMPIIALTAHSMSGDQQKCLNAGCTDYLSKPVAGETLHAMLSRHLRPPPSVRAPSP